MLQVWDGPEICIKTPPGNFEAHHIWELLNFVTFEAICVCDGPS